MLSATSTQELHALLIQHLTVYVHKEIPKMSIHCFPLIFRFDVQCLCTQSTHFFLGFPSIFFFKLVFISSYYSSYYIYLLLAVRHIMEMKNTRVEIIEQIRFVWYGHHRRMREDGTVRVSPMLLLSCLVDSHRFRNK